MGSDMRNAIRKRIGVMRQDNGSLRRIQRLARSEDDYHRIWGVPARHSQEVAQSLFLIEAQLSDELRAIEKLLDADGTDEKDGE